MVRGNRRANRPNNNPRPAGSSTRRVFISLPTAPNIPELDGRKSTAGGVQGIDLGYLKAGLFRADNRTFSITLAADPEDKRCAPSSGARVRDSGRTDRCHQGMGSAQYVQADQQGLPLRQSQQRSQMFRPRRQARCARTILRSATHTCTRTRFRAAVARSAGCPRSSWPTCWPTSQTRLQRAVEFEARVDATDSAVVSVAGRTGQAVDRHQQGACSAARIHTPSSDPTVRSTKPSNASQFSAKGIGAAAREHLDVLRALFRHTNLLDLPDALFARAGSARQNPRLLRSSTKTKTRNCGRCARTCWRCSRGRISGRVIRRMKKMFLAMLATETNTFSPLPTGWNNWRDTVLRRSQANTIRRSRVVKPSTRPLFSRLDARGWTLAPGLQAFAVPAGTTPRAVYESLRDELLEDLEASMPVDAVHAVPARRDGRRRL